MRKTQARNGPEQAARTGGGSVRIIAGDWRGRRLPVVDRPGLRPTPDRVRETLFNWLMPVIEGSRCLDLYAGSGALGFEAASRGARQVCLIEQDAQVAAALRDHIDRLQATDRMQVHCTDAMTWLRRPVAEPFDVVFIDPPYSLDLIAPTISALREHGWLAADAWLYCEWPLDRPAPVSEPPWRTGRAGNIAFALYRLPAGRV